MEEDAGSCEEAGWVGMTETGYGFFPGGDPRNFVPDEECCSPEEIESHRIACEEWDKGNRIAPSSGCVLSDGRIMNISTFGIGTYTFEAEEEPEDF